MNPYFLYPFISLRKSKSSKRNCLPTIVKPAPPASAVMLSPLNILIRRRHSHSYNKILSSLYDFSFYGFFFIFSVCLTIMHKIQNIYKQIKKFHKMTNNLGKIWLKFSAVEDIFFILFVGGNLIFLIKNPSFCQPS